MVSQNMTDIRQTNRGNSNLIEITSIAQLKISLRIVIGAWRMCMVPDWGLE